MFAAPHAVVNDVEPEGMELLHFLGDPLRSWRKARTSGKKRFRECTILAQSLGFTTFI